MTSLLSGPLKVTDAQFTPGGDSDRQQCHVSTCPGETIINMHKYFSNQMFYLKKCHSMLKAKMSM